MTVMKMFHKAWVNRRPSVVVAWMLLTASGCGAKAPHSGRPWLHAQVTVIANGEPLAAGEVAFLAAQGSTGVDAGGFIDAKGTVRIPILPGSYVVVIRPLAPPEFSPSDGSAAEPRARDTGIPRRYRSPSTSPLAVEILKGEKHTFTFDLTP